MTVWLLPPLSLKTTDLPTPVIAFNRGSLPELIQDKKTGFLVNNMDEAADAVDKLYSIDRTDCRLWACSSFSSEKMTEDYIKVYEQILGSKKV